MRRKVTTLNKRISVITETRVPDGMGGEIVTPVEFCRAWAAIWPVKAKEARENMREQVTVSHNIRIAYRPGILHTMTVGFGARTFEVKSVINPDETNRWLDMVCNEIL